MVAAHQQLTWEWWGSRLRNFEAYISQPVLDEAARGDPEVAAKRLGLLSTLPVLEVDNIVVDLAESIVKSGAIPAEAAPDALHIAIAAVNGMDYLLTWNCTHIHNGVTLRKVEDTCHINGFVCPVICTPEELMEDSR